MKFVIWFLALVVFFTMGEVVAAEGDGDSAKFFLAEVPLPVRGDEWTFFIKRKSDLSRSDIPVGELTIKITDEGIDAPFGVLDNMPTIVENVSPKRWIKIPLEKTWKSEWKSGIPRGRGGRSDDTISTYTVVGWETKSVKAGTFRAIKIRRDDTLSRGYQWFEYWYVPEIKGIIKAISENGAGTTYDVELLRFKLSSAAE